MHASGFPLVSMLVYVNLGIWETGEKRQEKSNRNTTIGRKTAENKKVVCSCL